MLINAIAALRRASPWQRTGLSPLEVPLYKLKFTIFITLSIDDLSMTDTQGLFKDK
jgi:hypothetical protein